MTTACSEDLIDNAPIREAVKRAVSRGVTLSEICHRLGWERGDGNAETSRLRRRIGDMPHIAGSGYLTIAKTMHYDIAVQIVRALDLDPVDLGL